MKLQQVMVTIPFNPSEIIKVKQLVKSFEAGLEELAQLEDLFSTED